MCSFLVELKLELDCKQDENMANLKKAVRCYMQNVQTGEASSNSYLLELELELEVLDEIVNWRRQFELQLSFMQIIFTLLHFYPP